jgi:hypothetical protein
LSKPDFNPPTRWGRPKQALKVVPCGLTKFYELLNSGRIRSKKVDGMRLVDLDSCEQLGENLTPNETENPDPPHLKRRNRRYKSVAGERTGIP